jgi:hypothetical protein
MQLADQVFDIEFLPEAGIELRQPGFDIRPKARQQIDPLKQIATQSLLCGLRQIGRFRDGKFECFDHDRLYHNADLRRR